VWGNSEYLSYTKIKIPYYFIQIMELVIQGQVQGLKWSAAHIIPGHPKCGRVHGHDYTLDVKLIFPESKRNMDLLRKTGYVMDYGDIKKVIKEIIQPLDHHFLIPATKLHSANTFTNLQSSEYNITLPTQDFCALDVDVVSSENLSLYFKHKLMETFDDIEVYCKVNEGQGQGVWF
jgi:6-pyruvoyltetrahydropterin/6-carboxytetrahydropterin synthase